MLCVLIVDNVSVKLDEPVASPQARHWIGGVPVVERSSLTDCSDNEVPFARFLHSIANDVPRRWLGIRVAS